MIQTIFGSPVVILKFSDVEKIFPNKLYEEMVDHLMAPENKFVDHPYARGGKICTTDLNLKLNNDKLIQLDPLLNFLRQEGLNYSYLFSDKKIKDLKFDNTWMNLTFKGCEIKNHYDKYKDTEFKSLITLFYPKAILGGSNLVFIHNSMYGQWPSECPETDIVKISIEEGTIIIFDNSILHAVDVHNSSNPRMCIAVEFKLEVD
jgi:hypothetical protein